jgi:tRNA uridine 5-carboxymethylaminomethyl modification enzyme
MFTSRAEYRLMLREDNADARLTQEGRRLGVVTEERWAAFERKREAIAREEERLRGTYVSAGFKERHSLLELLRRPEMKYADVVALADADLATKDSEVAEQVEIRTKYAGYIERQQEEVARRSKTESLALPSDLDYKTVRGLSAEVQQKLNDHRPETIGQASRISGVTPAAISLLLVHMKRGFRAPEKKTA